MKNRLLKVTFLLLAGLMLFASCKHEGLPVKEGAVQIDVGLDGDTEILSIPVEIYDALFDKFSFVIDAYNKDTILTEEKLTELKEFSSLIYGLDVFEAADFPDDIKEEMMKLVSEKDADKLVKKLSKLSEEQQDKLSDDLSGISDIFDVFGAYLEEIVYIKNGDSWYDSKADFLKDFKSAKQYDALYIVVAQIFPKIEILAK